MIPSLQSFQQARRQVLGNELPLAIEKYESIESILTQYHYAEKRALYMSAVEQTSQKIFSKVFSLKTNTTSKLQALENRRGGVQKLKEELEKGNSNAIKEAFHQLPDETKSYLRWAIWFNDWLKNKNTSRIHHCNYGTEELERDIFTLRENDKVIYLSGHNLVDQLLLSIEEKLCVERQEEIVQILSEISKSNPADLLQKIETLPIPLQWKIHEDIQNLSKAKHLGFEWGKRKLYKDPSVVLQLKHPQTGKTLLNHHLHEQTELLNCCNLAADVNDFEKTALLFALSHDPKQKEILEKWLSPRVREWISSLAKPTPNAPLPALQIQKPSHPKLYETRGAHYCNGVTSFEVFAPHARSISVVLTTFGRENSRIPMQKNADGVWETKTKHALPGKTYLYLVEDCQGKQMLRTDPFSFSTVDVPEAGQIQSVVTDSSKYVWKDQSWMNKRAEIDPLQAPLSIYELQLKSWKSGFNQPLNYREIAPPLISYCKSMGFTHVEIYGILDHFYKEARGYQVANFFAPYRGCGNCDDFKYFVDQLHQKGIGVIIDWIPTHFQHYHQNSAYSVSMHEFDGTNLYAAELSIWGTMYLDYSKEETRRLMSASALYFIDQLHIDGIRYDAISQMVHRNGKDYPDGISFLQQLNDTIRTSYPGVLTIAEETEGFPNVTKPTKLGGLGFDLKWNIGWSHDSRNFMRTPYHERQKHWQHKVINYLNGAMHGEKTILTHSHDDTDTGENSNSNVLIQCIDHEQNLEGKFANLRNFFSLQTLAPSWGHMIHMGDELVQSDSWYQRFRKNLPSVDWQLPAKSPQNLNMQNCISDLNALYLNKPQLWEKGENGFKLIAEYGPNAVVAYHRGTQGNKRIAIVHNFSDRGYTTYDLPLPRNDPAIGRIRKVSQIFSTDHFKYGGSGKYENTAPSIISSAQNPQPTHLRMPLPPQSTIVLEEELG